MLANEPVQVRLQWLARPVEAAEVAAGTWHRSFSATGRLALAQASLPGEDAIYTLYLLGITAVVLTSLALFMTIACVGCFFFSCCAPAPHTPESWASKANRVRLCIVRSSLETYR